jgi:phosphate transport system substrate-binding protein
MNDAAHAVRFRAGLALLLALTIGLAAGCAPESRRAQSVTVKGSDTMVLLGQRWAEEYMKGHPGSVIQVTGGGSGTGIAALINGTTDICQASRPMKDAERDQAAKTHGQPPVQMVMARDGLSVYLNEANGVQALTLAQLETIYNGTVTNWKEVGGRDAPIIAYGRENNSGTYTFFKEHVLHDHPYAAAVQSLPGTAAVVNAVARDPNGIGYGGAAYAKGVRECPLRKDDASPAIMPTRENVMSGAYPISRELYWYTASAPTGPVKEFTDWALSSEGQGIVTQVGYFPIH